MRPVRALLAAFTLLSVAACGGEAEREVGLAGIVRTPAPVVADVTLPEVTNGMHDEFAFRAEPGGLLVTYFGYTTCPDVCPTTMADLRNAVRQLDEDDADAIDVAFATVDPDRDTDAATTAYIHAFFPDGHALRTEDPNELARAADAFGAVYSVEENDEGYIEVEHSAFLYAIDDEGKILLSWPFGIEPDLIANDLRILMEEEST
ncbi:MAG: SCO family protein [Acidimicrobiia bacterium]|nr:SCO family protein [Acidimicrobiia bacterium]